MINPHVNEQAVLARECVATQIPSGEKVVLPSGAHVTILQTLGGHFTVLTPQGVMVRIDDKDASALGEEFAGAAAAAQTEAQENALANGPYSEQEVWEQLKTVFDPEIPVNIVDLGLVYSCEATPHPEGGQKVDIKMTMTAPGCGMGNVIKEDVRRKVMTLSGVRDADVEVVWEPAWDQSRMSDAARLQLGWL
jgi:probable FeS assembly SUF system protein SufT